MNTADGKGTMRAAQFSLSITAILGLIAAYTHFFGYSYFRGYIEGFGLNGAEIDLSPEQAIFYALEGYTRIFLSGSFPRNLEELVPSSLKTGFLFSLVFLTVFIARKFARKLEFDFSKMRADREGVLSYIGGVLDSNTRSFAAFIMVLFAGSALHFMIAAVIFFVVLLFWLLMILGVASGQSLAYEHIDKNVCEETQWEVIKRNRVANCSAITLKDGTKLIGKELHRSSQVRIFVTNEIVYEISSEGVVRTVVPLVRRPAPKA